MSLTILLDCDGPLADFDGHFWNTAIDCGYEMDIESRHDQKHRFFTDHIKNKKQRNEIRNHINNSRWFRDLPVTPESQKSVAELEELGYDLWVCTKPLDANKYCAGDKHTWIREHFPSLSKKVIIAPNKSLIKGDILFDDAINLSHMEVAEWKPIVFATSYNGEGSKWSNLERKSWKEFVEHFSDIRSKV